MEQKDKHLCHKCKLEMTYVRDTDKQEREVSKMFNGKPQLKIYRCFKCYPK